MQKIILIVTLAVLSFKVSNAQVPQAVNYQSVVRDASGSILPNHQLGMRFTIQDSVNPGVPLYRETQTGTTNQFGIYTAQIGYGNPDLGSFAAINWATGHKYLLVELDLTQTNNYLNMGQTQLIAVPYAFRAQSVEHDSSNLGGVLAMGNNANGLSIINAGNVAIGTATPAPSAALDVSTTTGAVLLPRLNNTQRDALTPVEGMMIYNTDLRKFQGYELSDSVTDQSQELTSFGGGEDRAQSFTAGLTGILTGFALPLSSSSGTYMVNVDLLDGAGTGGTVLSHQIYTITHTSVTWVTFAVSGVNVVAGSQYTIHVWPRTTCVSAPCYYWGGSNSNPYPGGDLYYNGTLVSVPLSDCAFKTFVEAAGWNTLH